MPEKQQSVRTSARTPSRAGESVRSRARTVIPEALAALDSPEPGVRRGAIMQAAEAFRDGSVVRPQETGWVNVLARTSHSFPRGAFSPARLAWEGAIRGLSVIGCADRDSLAALEEMPAAANALGVRATVSLDTKVQVPERAGEELNCPGEPGVLRVLAAGFAALPAPESMMGRFISALPEFASARNRALTEKLNVLLAPVRIDYDVDVLLFAPDGSRPDEEVARAYTEKARELFPDRSARAVFWADVLGRSPGDVEELMSSEEAFLESLREKMLSAEMRGGGLTSGGYHPADDFFRAAADAGTVPAIAWRGALAEREDAGQALDWAMALGARAVSLRPERFWNIPGKDERALGLARLARLARAARERKLPLLAGTPAVGVGVGGGGSGTGKFVDAFDAPELAAYSRDFTAGALWLHGRTGREK